MRKYKDNPITAARIKAGMTQGQLAKAIGVDQCQVSVWECGRRPISINAAKRIAAALNIDWVQLIDVQGNDNGSPIARARQRKGFTQTQLANVLSVSQAQISNYEHGVCMPPKEMLQRMALILETDCYSLMPLSDSRNNAVQRL